MSNSSLVTITKLSPNHSGKRTHVIDTITIHCVVGHCTASTIGDIFLPKSRQASCNYGVDDWGGIVLCVDEANRSWCTSSNSNDQRAITIEVASDSTEPYAFTNSAYQTLIKLVVDICKRNNIKKLVWSTDKNSRVNHLNGCNLTVHRDYANKSCPGNWMYAKMGEFADTVNQQLVETPKPEPKPEPKPDPKPEPKEDYLATMTEKEFNAILDKKLAEVKPTIYKFIEDVPEWGRKSVQKCLDTKVMSGTGTENGKIVLDISADLLRAIVLLDRSGVFSK